MTNTHDNVNDDVSSHINYMTQRIQHTLSNATTTNERIEMLLTLSKCNARHIDAICDAMMKTLNAMRR